MSILPLRTPTPDIFISSDQRCGGTALNQIARALLGASCLDDPYTRRRGKAIAGLPCTLPPDGEPADCLARIYRRWRCIKLCSTTWEPAVYRPIVTAAIDRGCRMTLLYRENALQRALSLALAQRTRVYDTYDWTGGDADSTAYEAQRVELDIAQLREFVELYQRRTDDVRELLGQRVPGYLEVRYESLFGVQLSISDKLVQLRRLCQYWGVDASVLETRKDKIERVLRPSQKLNTPALYRRMVSNFDAVAAAFDPALHGDLEAIY